MEWLSTGEAAERLRVSDERVRQLIGSGQLLAVRKSSGWLVHVDSVETRLAGTSIAGRPLDPATAWGVIAVLSHGTDVSALASARPGLPRLVRRALHRSPPADQWPAWLARRSATSVHRAHPGVLDRMRRDGVVSVGGVWAAAASGLDVSPADTLDLYVDEVSAVDLLVRHRTSPDATGNVVVRIVPGVVPAALAPAGGVPAPLLVAALDLAEATDSRVRTVGTREIERVTRGVSGVATTLHG